MARNHITRSQRLLEQYGIVDRTEHYISIPARKSGKRKFGIRRDLFGIFDLILVTNERILGVQVTDHSSITSHKQKIEQAEVTYRWLCCGGQIMLHLWKKKSGRWLLKIIKLVRDEYGTQVMDWIDVTDGYEQPKSKDGAVAELDAKEA